MTNYLRGVEWLDRATDSRYPLIPSASGLDQQGVFLIPNDLLSELYIAIPADLPIRPGQLYISRVLHTTNLVSIVCSAIVSGSPVEIGRFDISQLSAQAQIERLGFALAIFEGAVGYEDLRGRMSIGRLTNLALQPQGEFRFDLAAALLDPDCIRPHIRHVQHVTVQQPTGSVRLSGSLRLQAGNNTRLRVEVEDGEPVIVIDAIDVTDLNENLECEQGNNPAIRRINGLGGNAAREIDILGSRCFEVTPSLTQLQLRNRCSEPCATCEETEALRDLIAPFDRQIPALVSLVNRLEIAILNQQNSVAASQGGSVCSPPSET